MDYRTAVRETWQPSDLKTVPLMQELVHYATLAASSHNTQPWKFELGSDHVSILPDFTRRCPQVDVDDHHLFVSLGCATENLLLAAQAIGRGGEVIKELDTVDGDAIRIMLERAPPSATDLFQAIPSRQCTRTAYDARLVDTRRLRLLEEAGTGDGVHVQLFTDANHKKTVSEYVAEGNVAQIGDRLWVEELKLWLRFDEREAVAKRDGLYAKCSGSPEVPRVLGELFMQFPFTPKSRNKTDVSNILSSAGIAVFISDADDKAHWIEAGRCYERFALQATALGIRNALVNQPVEVAELRPAFAGWLGISEGRPDLAVRFGHGSEMPRSLRRPVNQVISVSPDVPDQIAA